MVDPDVVVLVFSSGKVVLTKAKETEHVYDAFEKIYPVLVQFRRKT
jgi:transcription initiation factor TFIID TATA-box-binding protein